MKDTKNKAEMFFVGMFNGKMEHFLKWLMQEIVNSHSQLYVNQHGIDPAFRGVIFTNQVVKQVLG